MSIEVGYTNMLSDIPSPIDLRLMSDAQEWEEAAMSKRPWRTDFFQAFASEIRSSGVNVHRILELGSGPGFLAAHLLGAIPSVEYVALDFSLAMHELAANRLGPMASRVKFVERSFRDPAWPQGLGQFECAVTNQAVHELRHKRYAAALHQQVRSLLPPGGVYLVCDHFAGQDGMKDNQLYMTVPEQVESLASAGFSRVKQVLLKGGLVLHRAT
jgi:SAM-dependent methyltransferase